MRWHQESKPFRAYLAITYCLSLPTAIYSLTGSGDDYGVQWIVLTVTSIFAATINVRLPKISSVISMGDVFIIVCLFRFGPGPALVTYWIDITVAHFSDVFRTHGYRIFGR